MIYGVSSGNTSLRSSEIRVFRNVGTSGNTDCLVVVPAAADSTPPTSCTASRAKRTTGRAGFAAASRSISRSALLADGVAARPLRALTGDTGLAAHRCLDEQHLHAHVERLRFVVQHARQHAQSRGRDRAAAVVQPTAPRCRVRRSARSCRRASSRRAAGSGGALRRGAAAGPLRGSRAVRRSAGRSAGRDLGSTGIASTTPPSGRSSRRSIAASRCGVGVRSRSSPLETDEVGVGVQGAERPQPAAVLGQRPPPAGRRRRRPARPRARRRWSHPGPQPATLIVPSAGFLLPRVGWSAISARGLACRQLNLLDFRITARHGCKRLCHGGERYGVDDADLISRYFWK